MSLAAYPCSPISTPNKLASPSRLRWCVLTLLIVAFATVQTVFIRKPGELPVYLKAADRMIAGEPIYRTDDGPAFSYPPFFVLPFIPLALLPERVADFVWNLVNLAQAAGVVGLLFAIMRRVTRNRTPGIAWLGLAVLLSARLFVSPLEYRSHDFIVALLLLGGLVASIEKRESYAGLLLGLATACKATPLVFLPMLIVQRRFKAAGVFVAACLLVTLLPDLLFPAASGRSWSAQWYGVFVSKVDAAGPAVAHGAWRAWNPLNQSLSGTLYRLTSDCETPEFAAYDVAPFPLAPVPKRILTLLVLASVYLVSLYCCYYAGKRRESLPTRSWSDTALWSVLIAETLLLSPMTSKTHFAPLVLGVALAVLANLHAAKRNWLLAAGLTVLFLVGTCMAKDIVGRHIGTWALIAGSLTWCALICWGLNVYLLLRGDPRKSIDIEPATASP